jgi:hypothetical protein
MITIARLPARTTALANQGFTGLIYATWALLSG